jgi:hypothetical protein
MQNSQKAGRNRGIIIVFMNVFISFFHRKQKMASGKNFPPLHVFIFFIITHSQKQKESAKRTTFNISQLLIN